MKTTIELDGWWGQKSAYIKKSTALYKLKVELINELIKEGIISSKDIDRQNNTPHVAITDEKTPRSQNAYDKINDSKIVLDEKNIVYNKDFISINTGHSGICDTHYTLFYKKNIADDKGKIMIIIKKIIDNLD